MATRYCEHCGDRRDYFVNCRPDTVNVHGFDVHYNEYFATCKECGQPIYVPELNDANVEAIEDAYRKEAKLITVDEIKRIMEKYDITANPLSKVMGFGEVTIARYLSGSTPSRKNSEVLLQVAASTTEMDRRLEAAKSIITDNAYEKCRKAIDRLLSFENCKKIEYVTQYFLRTLRDVTPMAIQKLLYFAQAFFAALNGHTFLFEDDCQAWANGPVYPDVYYRYRCFGYTPIDISEMPFEHPELFLSPREREVINAVAESFGQFSGGVLRNITHMENPWIKARGNLPDGARSTNVIEKSDIVAYFDDVVRDYGIKAPCDIKRYSKAMTAKG